MGLGCLAPGRRADMVALRQGSLTVTGTWLGGVWQRGAHSRTQA